MSACKAAIKTLLESRSKDDELVFELGHAIRNRDKDPDNIMQYAFFLFEKHSSEIFNKHALERLIELLINFKHWEIKESRNAATIIHRLGKLELEKRKVYVSASAWNSIFRLIEKITFLNPNSREISSTIWALAKLIDTKGCPPLSKEVFEALETLIKELSRKHPNDRDISMVLWGLGKLAEARQCHTFSIETQNAINTITQDFSRGNCDAQSVSNTLLGLAKLAEADLIPHFIQKESMCLNYILQDLHLKHPKSQEIASTFWGLGKLAESSKCPIFAKETFLGLDTLVQYLSAKHPTTQEISNTMWGIGKLIEIKQCPIFSKEAYRSVNALIDSFAKILMHNLCHDQEAQHISNVFWGLGKLMEADLKYPFILEVPKSIDILIQVLSKVHLQTQAVAVTLFGLGKLAEVEQCPTLTKESSASLDFMIRELRKNKPEERHFSNVMWGLGKLAEQNLLLPFSKEASEAIKMLVYDISKMNPNPQAITNIVWGLGKLAEAQLCSPLTKEAWESLNVLIPYLALKYNEPYDISNTILGLARLLESRYCPPFSETLCECLNRMAQNLHNTNPLQRHITTVAYAMAILEVFSLDTIKHYIELTEKIVLKTNLQDKQKLSKDDLKNMMQIHFFYAWCFVKEIEKAKIIPLYKNLTRALQANAPESSAIHKKYYSLLNSMIEERNKKEKDLVDGIRMAIEWPEYGTFLDIAIITPHLKINIEVNGERYHYESDGVTLQLYYQNQQKRKESMKWIVKNINVDKEDIRTHIENEVLPYLKKPKPLFEMKEAKESKEERKETEGKLKTEAVSTLPANPITFGFKNPAWKPSAAAQMEKAETPRAAQGVKKLRLNPDAPVFKPTYSSHSVP